LPRLQSPAHCRGGRPPARHNAACDVRRPRSRAAAAVGNAAGGAPAGRSGPRILLRIRFCRRRGRHEDGDAILDQPGYSRPDALRRVQGGYHGDTTGAMAVCDPETGMHACFEGCCRSIFVVDLPDTADRAEALSGSWSATPAKLRGSLWSRWCKAPAACGSTTPVFCSGCAQWRTLTNCCSSSMRYLPDWPHGAMFACTPAGITPDIITLSKALTGGTLPLAATVAGRKVFEAFWSDDPVHALMHGPTYMGNALACRLPTPRSTCLNKSRAWGRSRIFRGRWREASHHAGNWLASKTFGSWGRLVWSSCTHRRSRGLAAPFHGGRRIIRPFWFRRYLTPAFTIDEDELATLTGRCRQGGQAVWPDCVDVIRRTSKRRCV